jgi:hypothetical protein
MKYVIIRAQCKLSNGVTKVFRYDADSDTEQNTCSNIEVFRANLKKTIEAQMETTVLSIALTYEECDSRK